MGGFWLSVQRVFLLVFFLRFSNHHSRYSQAFNIVDPEEIPHMLDLHLFLGRVPVNEYITSAATEDDGKVQQ